MSLSTAYNPSPTTILIQTPLDDFGITGDAVAAHPPCIHHKDPGTTGFSTPFLRLNRVRSHCVIKNSLAKISPHGNGGNSISRTSLRRSRYAFMFRITELFFSKLNNPI